MENRKPYKKRKFIKLQDYDFSINQILFIFFMLSAIFPYKKNHFILINNFLVWTDLEQNESKQHGRLTFTSFVIKNMWAWPYIGE
jgi:hypothetical protein